MINAIVLRAILGVIGSVLFSTGLSQRIDLQKLPDLWQGNSLTLPWGTFPGLLVAIPGIVVSSLTGAEWLGAFVTGGLAFAVGATNLQVMKLIADQQMKKS